MDGIPKGSSCSRDMQERLFILPMSYHAPLADKSNAGATWNAHDLPKDRWKWLALGGLSTWWRRCLIATKFHLDGRTRHWQAYNHDWFRNPVTMYQHVSLVKIRKIRLPRQVIFPFTEPSVEVWCFLFSLRRKVARFANITGWLGSVGVPAWCIPMCYEQRTLMLWSNGGFAFGPWSWSVRDAEIRDWRHFAVSTQTTCTS